MGDTSQGNEFIMRVTSVFFPLGLYFSFHDCVLIENIGRFMSQTRGSHRSLRQSHLKGETEQRSTELDVFCVRHAMTNVTGHMMSISYHKDQR